MYLILEYSSSLLSYLLKTTLMHVYVVDEALFRACEIHSPWLRGSGPRTWPIWPYILGGSVKCMFFMSMKPSYMILPDRSKHLWAMVLSNRKGLWASCLFNSLK